MIDNDEEDIETITLDKTKIAEAWSVERIESVDEDGNKSIYFTVIGEKIEKFARRTDFSNYEGVNRLRDILKKLGIAHELRRRGAEGNSIIKIGDSSFDFLEQ